MTIKKWIMLNVWKTTATLQRKLALKNEISKAISFKRRIFMSSKYFFFVGCF